MGSVTVKLAKFRQSPRKLRLVADLVRTKPVSAAEMTLTHLEKRAARPLSKLLKSAIAAALAKNLDKDKLKIQELRVDEGPRLKRWLPAPRGRSYRIRKPTAHITLTLSDEMKKNNAPFASSRPLRRGAEPRSGGKRSQRSAERGKAIFPLDDRAKRGS